MCEEFGVTIDNESNLAVHGNNTYSPYNHTLEFIIQSHNDLQKEYGL